MSPHEPSTPSRLVPVLLAGMIVSQLTNSMVTVAVPTILHDLDAGVGRAGLIILAYLLPVAVLMPTWGAIGDLFGRRRAFRAGLVIFAGGAALSATSLSLPMLLAGQVVQAVGASALNPIGTALVGEAGGMTQRGRALGRQRMILSVAGIAGAPLGGLLVQVYGWHAVFVIGPIVAMVVFVLIGRHGAERRPHAGTLRFDVAGAVVITATLLCLLAALSLGRELGWTSPTVLILAGLSIAGFFAVWAIESRQSRPLIPPFLFRQRAYVAVVTTGLLQAIACFGTMLLGPLLLQGVFALEPARSGWLLAAFPLGMAASGIPGGRLTDRFGGHHITSASLVGVAAGLLLLRLAATAGQAFLYVPGALVTGFMAGVGLTAMGAVVLQICGPASRGVALGVFTMISIMGDAVGVALFPVLLAEQNGDALALAFSNVYLIAAIVAVVALLPAAFLRHVEPVHSPVIASETSD